MNQASLLLIYPSRCECDYSATEGKVQ